VVWIATSRDGPDLDTLRENTTASRYRIYEQSLKLAFVPPEASQKRAVARDVGEGPGQELVEEQPTFGWITMRRAFELMRARFEGLNGELQDGQSPALICGPRTTET
jgi:hypothetical protein